MSNKERKKLFSVSISDCRVDFYRGSGAGGQKVNKTSSACRITHEPSGAVGQSEDHREQSRNKKEAWIRMRSTPKFTAWLKMETSRAMTGKSIDQIVDEQLLPEKIKIEIKDNGKFKEVKTLTGE